MIDYEVYHFEKIEGPAEGLPLLTQAVVGLSIVGVFVGLCYSVYTRVSNNPSKKGTAIEAQQNLVSAPPINQPEVIKKNDTVYVINNGQAIPVTTPVTLASGATVNSSGQITYSNGTTVTIENNQALYPDGSVNYQTSNSIAAGGTGGGSTEGGGSTGGGSTGGSGSTPTEIPTPTTGSGGGTGGGTTPSDTPIPTSAFPSVTAAPSPTSGPTDVPTPTPTSPVPTPTDIPIPTGRSTTVALIPVDGSGQSGTANISEINSQVKVQVSVSGGWYPNQPTYVRRGVCPDADNVIYSLANTLYGYGQTVVNATYDQFLAQKPITISLHHSAFQINTFTSCGNVP